jgi:hypothetical protein
VEVPAGVDGHFFVTDSDGHRLLDANKPASEALSLSLPDSRPLWLIARDRSFKLEGKLEGKVEAAASPIFVAQADARPPATVRGGPIEDQLAWLFEQPLDASFVAAVDAFGGAPIAVDSRPQKPRSWTRDPQSLGLLGAGGAALLLGAALAIPFSQSLADVNRASNLEIDADLTRYHTLLGVMSASAAAGVALLAAGAIRAASLSPSNGVHVSVAPVGPAGAGGLSMEMSW